VRKIFSHIVSPVFIVIAIATVSHANLIVVEFSGVLENVCGRFPPCDGFGLGLNVGDPFSAMSRS
jgi:hypothetical protein